jgi:hypothetical protein
MIGIQGSVSNGSDKIDLKDIQVVLSGANQTLSTRAPLTLKSLSIEGGGIKTTQGDLKITGNMVFTQGILTPTSGKVLYSGSTILTGNANSFVNGTFYQVGKGIRFFPIGTGNTYMPMSLNNVEDANAEIGVTGFTAGTNLELPADINSLATNRYWQVDVSGGSLRAFNTSLYVPGSSIDASQKAIVVQADDVNSTAINLGGGVTDDFVTSFSPVTKPILTIGIAEKIEVKIHDLITPFNADDINDKLKIINIEFTYENKVTLLDRWGVPVKEWTNFRNYDDANNPNQDAFDFSRLGPGNYICVLEYKMSADAPLEKVNQTISILK